MENKFDYTSVPFHFVHCFNQNCPRKADCLRHLTARHAPSTVSYVMIINPAAYPADAGKCRHFKDTKKVNYAWGVNGILEKAPYLTALKLKKDLRDMFTKTTYYRIINKERPLSPLEQELIARIAVKHGITTPLVHDSYTESYNWED